MNVTIGARCWDGVRSKTLYRPEPEIIKHESAVEITNKKPRFSLHGLEHLLPLGLIPLVMNVVMPGTGFAASPDSVPAMSQNTQDMILKAFDPLIHLIISLSYPVAGIMIAAGCLLIMVQQKEKGVSMLQNASIGYILVQMSPLLLKLLVGIGSDIKF